VRARHPQVAAALDWLSRFGRARLSGTGGCVFLECASLAQARKVALQCPASFVAQLAAGVEVSPLQRALSRQRG
jgi:4-diphosphocytidyl-2-C-methyl-D-erythritol kinase